MDCQNTEYKIVEFQKVHEEEWDHFIYHESCNGTFLQTRKFLNYHKEGKFQDCSLLFYKKNKLAAVCPACLMIEDGKKVFFSHKGSTFGGLIINKKYYHAEKVLQIIEQLDSYLQNNGYQKCVLKITPDLFATESNSLLQYCLQNRNYCSYMELNTYIDLDAITGPVIDCFDRNKKRNIEKCEAHSLTFRRLVTDGEIEDFYRLLTKNLEKYDLKPIHTVDEIKEFKNERLIDETEFYGVFREEEQIAGGMMFVFKQTNVIHAQNLSADYTFTEYSPITYLYYKVIEKAKNDGYSKLSWGISTENQGKDLNMSLVRNKESYGSKYSLNTVYYKTYE